MRMFLVSASLLLFTPQVVAAFDTSQGSLTVTEIASGLNEPWGVDFLSGGSMLVTERGGRLLIIGDDGERNVVKNVPKVVAKGQGGLMDVMVPRDFATSREIFLSASIRQKRGVGTALIKAVLDDTNAVITKSEVIFQQAQGFRQAKHFGSRIVEARDGTLYLTIGDRGEMDEAQNTTNHNGSVVRVRRSGMTPPNNPLVGLPGAEPEIYSYGHRNPQGAALDLNGNLWVAEHGARGGDEINRVKAGANYGWPEISYGTHYNGNKIGQGTQARGMEQPAHYWDPSIAPSGMMIYSGKLWPQWRGNFFVGSLKFDYIARLDGKTFQQEVLQSNQTGRVRDVVEGPNGAIWYLSVDQGALFKVTP